MKNKFIIIICLSTLLSIDNSICHICFEPLNKFYLKDAWGNKYHQEHLEEGTFCGTCSRIISKRITRGGFQFADGRFMCNLCEASIIKTDESKLFSISIDSVIKILNSKGINLEGNEFEINLVDRYSLQSSIHEISSHNLENLKAITILDDKKYVINILWGLHQLEFEGVLAHELVHIWADYHNMKLSNSKLEGLCNVGSAFIYKNNNTELSNVLLKSLENDNDPIYGYGYKYINVIIKKYGWKDVVNKLINHNYNWLN